MKYETFENVDDLLDQEDAIDQLMSFGLNFSQAYHMVIEHVPEPEPADVVDRSAAFFDPYSEYE